MSNLYKWVNIAQLNPQTDNFEVLVRASMRQEGPVSFEGDQTIIKDLQDNGVNVYTEPFRLYPEDGLPFLEALAAHFNNPMTRQASGVREGDELPPFPSPLSAAA